MLCKLGVASPITGNLHLYNGVDNPFSYIRELLNQTIDTTEVIIE